MLPLPFYLFGLSDEVSEDLIHKGIMTSKSTVLPVSPQLSPVSEDLIHKGIMTLPELLRRGWRDSGVSEDLTYKGIMTLLPSDG